MLEEVGLGQGRLMLFHLPGSAVQDMALGAGASAPGQRRSNAQTEGGGNIRDQFVAHVARLARPRCAQPACRTMSARTGR